MKCTRRVSGSCHHWRQSPYGDAPVEVSCHGAGLQVHVEPRLALAVDVGSPLLVLFQYPLLEPLLILVQGQIPVLGLAQHGLRTADGGLGIDKLGGREVASALLALVAVGTLVVAVRALAGDVAVGQELVGLLVVVLFGGFLGELSLVVELAEEVGCKLVVGVAGGAAVDVEAYSELLEALLYHRVVAVYHVLGRDALFLGAYGDGHSVLVATADEHHLLLLQAQIAHVDVCRHVDSGQVSDVDSTVGVWQCSRDGGTLIVGLFHLYCVISLFMCFCCACCS